MAVVMAFITVSFAELFCAINMRSRTGSIFRREMWENMNWWLVGATVVAVALTLAAVYVPGFKTLFSVYGTLPAKILLICIGLSLSTVPVFELGKAIQRTAMKKKQQA